MAMKTSRQPIPADQISDAIVVIRGQRVMLDATLASPYSIETRVLVQSVKRNRERFPDDFCFRLTPMESQQLRSQTVISSSRHGGRRSTPYAFTEQGVAMLSSVLRSPAAVAVNIEIMRAFVVFRRALAESKQLEEKFSELDQRLGRRLTEQDAVIAQILEAIRKLLKPPEPRRRPIGFATEDPAS